MLRRVVASTILLFAAGAFAQEPSAPPARAAGARREPAGPPRPPLFFREEWKQAPGAGEHAVDTAGVANANLELKLYGTDGKDIQITGEAGNQGNPIHLWTGLCTAVCGATLRDKENYVDLTGIAKIRWVTKVSGLHKVHPVLRLADGTFLVGDHEDGSTADWLQSEFLISEVHWLRLDPEKLVTKGNFVPKPDLSKVDEIGFTDLIPGSGHGPGGWVDVAAIEVYGKPVKR